MTATAFALLMAGVLLNAGAQLLLKAGTNVLGVLTLTRDTLARHAGAMATQGHFVLGAACYVLSLFVWILGLSRVPVSVAYPLLSVGYIVNAIAAHYLFGEAVTATRWLGIGFIVVGVMARRPELTGAHERTPYLKFAGPVLDEATIAGVGDVLRSGYIASGPWVRRFEQALSDVLRRPAGASADLGDRGRRGRAAARRHRPGRRGDHLRAELLHRPQHDRQGRRDAGVRRLRPRHAQHRPRRRSRRRSRRARRRSCRRTGRARSSTSIALYALARSARTARDRGCRAGPGIAVEGPQRRRDRRPRHVQLPSEQEHDDDRGRRARRQRRGRGGARRGAALPRHHVPRRPHARRRVSRRQVQPARRQRAHRRARSSRGCRRSSPRAARSSSATSSASRPTRAACCRRARSRTTASRGTCSPCCCRSIACGDHRQAVPRRARRRAASAPVYRTRRCTCRRSAAGTAASEGQFPMPSASRARRSRCRCMQR